MNLGRMTAVIEGKRYDTETATLLADNVVWDGHNFERNGRNTWLFKSPKGQFFFAHRTMWQGETDHIELCDEREAREFFENQHNDTHVDYAKAFGEPAEG